MKALRKLVVAALAAAAIGSAGGHPKAADQDETADSPSGYQLKAEPYHCDKLYESIRCDGRVTNISELPLRHVLALAECFTKDETFVTSEWSVIEYDPVMPGQTSPYHVIIRYNPVIKGCRMSFKNLGGPAIPAADPDAPPAKRTKSAKSRPFDWNTATSAQREAFCADYGRHCASGQSADPACALAKTTCTSAR